MSNPYQPPGAPQPPLGGTPAPQPPLGGTPAPLPPPGVAPAPAPAPPPPASSRQPDHAGSAAESAESAESGKPKRAVSTGQILGGLLFVVVLVFVLENTRTVKVRLLFPEVKAPLAVALLIAAVLGAAIAWLLRYRRHRHHPTADRPTKRTDSKR